MSSIKEPELNEQIKQLSVRDEPVRTKLRTSQRVLARITDGIYRQPSSALRELISNAYDADATKVTIISDAPRFDTIKIIDNGNGFTPDSLAHMVEHIGGSYKRTTAGAEPGVVNQEDPSLSPKGRKLIGKIGIGLFSVSQLTKHFQVITKTAGTNYRTIADVTLKTHSEDELSQIGSKEKEPEFETGDVLIFKEPASDVESHGTEIILMDLLTRIKKELRSADLWDQINTSRSDPEVKKPIEPPPFHIGLVDAKTGDTIVETAKLPWDGKDDPTKRFEKLIGAMDAVAGKTQKPNIRNTFDNYLQMLWTLSLSAPLDYIGKHPFDMTGVDGVRVFRLSNSSRKGAEEVYLDRTSSVREKLELQSPVRGTNFEFSVIIDGIELKRPLRFGGKKPSNPRLQPLLFVGKYEPDLSGFPKDNRGGSRLSFEGYLYWNPRIVPTDHIGALIRISDASGALFDNTFMNYQVSEQTRREQVSSEIFIKEGLDAALNIDRESFNFSHPHYYIVKQWVHSAFRQLATRHKEIGRKLREEKRAEGRERATGQLEELVANEIASSVQNSDIEIVPVEFAEGLEASEHVLEKRRSEGVLVFKRDHVLDGFFKNSVSAGRRELDSLFELKMKKIAQVLESFGLLGQLPVSQQEELLRIIAGIVAFEEPK